MGGTIGLDGQPFIVQEDVVNVIVYPVTIISA